jgi:hypothetical protein
MTETTINNETVTGLLSQKASSPVPKIGEKRHFSWEERPSKSGKSYTKIKNEGPEYGGELCRVLSVAKTDYADSYGNISFNVQFEPCPSEQVSQPASHTYQPRSEFQKAKAIMRRPEEPPSEDGILSTRQHLMQVANLYSLCVKAVDAAIAPHVPEALLTSEWLQAAVASLFIESSGRRTNDGINWWSYVDKMPIVPILKQQAIAEDDPF